MNFPILILLFAITATPTFVTSDEAVTLGDEVVTHGDIYYEDFEYPTETVVEDDYYEVLSDEPNSGIKSSFILKLNPLNVITVNVLSRLL